MVLVGNQRPNRSDSPDSRSSLSTRACGSVSAMKRDVWSKSFIGWASNRCRPILALPAACFKALQGRWGLPSPSVIGIPTLALRHGAYPMRAALLAACLLVSPAFAAPSARYGVEPDEKKYPQDT